MRNFHLPLPDDIYGELRAEAERVQRPATEVAREAIEIWLRHRRKVARAKAIARFAADNAGTSVDLDEDLESASLEYLRDAERNAT